MLRLNLGCSDQQMADMVNVDRWTPPWATPENFQCVDLEALPWPWETGSVEHIRMADIIEHLANKIGTMNELHRVLKPGDTVEIIVPTTDGRGAWQDPTHVSFWNRNSFFYFEDGNIHLERFKDAYGITARFKVAFEREQTLQDGVTKLHIVLEAVKADISRPDASESGPIMASATDGHGSKFAFSICHTSARPNEWRKVYTAWCDAAVNLSSVEYIVCMDARWGFTEAMARDHIKARQGNRVVWNTGRRCYVDGVNLAAAASTGDVLIVNADDQYPCDKWDERLDAQVQVAGMGIGIHEFVIEVSTNTPTEHERAILVLPILSRERYERFGWVFFPQYEGVYADNDFCAMARRDKCIIDARHLVFPHKHWMNGQREKDEQDHAQNRAEAYNEGKKLFAARRRINFAGIPPKVEPQEKPLNTTLPVIVIMTPGNNFGGVWLDAYTKLFGYMVPKYNISTLRQYTSNAAMTRTVMARTIMGTDYGVPVDYLLWIDDDNAVTPEQFERLLADLREHSEYDAVVGWTWCGNDDSLDVGRATISCGWLKDLEATPDGQDVKFTKIKQISPKEMYESPTDLIEIGYSGMPVVLMRYGLLEKAGPELFTPYVDPRCEYGVGGEDIAFFARATIRSGARYAVDRQVKVPHMKLRPIEPVLTKEQIEEALKATAAQMAMK
jgi:hypothetical protein